MNPHEMRLLIIDDDDAYREVLSRSLGRRGFSVSLAGSRILFRQIRDQTQAGVVARR